MQKTNHSQGQFLSQKTSIEKLAQTLINIGRTLDKLLFDKNLVTSDA